MLLCKEGTIKRLVSLILLVSILGFTEYAQAGKWYELLRDSSYQKINDAVSVSGDLEDVFAVGDNGYFYISRNNARNFDMFESGFAEHLFSVTAGHRVNGADTTLIAAGQDGVILKYDFNQKNWQRIDGQAMVNFYAAGFDPQRETFWLSGDNGVVIYSEDFGQTWEFMPLEIPDVNIRVFHSNLDGVFLAGVKNDTTYIFTKETDGLQFNLLADDIIPGFSVSAMTSIKNDLVQSDLIIAGNNTLNSGGEIWTKKNNLGSFLRPSLLSPLIAGGIRDIHSFNQPTQSICWLTTNLGDVWESRDNGLSWVTVYKQPDGLPLGPILFNDDVETATARGRIFGASGLILSYGFDLLAHDPLHNARINHPIEHLQLYFSSPPNLLSLQQNLYITSTISGQVPFSVEFSAFDSSHVQIIPQRNYTDGTIPGESWNVTLSDKIFEQDQADNAHLIDYNFDIHFMSPFSPGFNFEAEEINLIMTEPAGPVSNMVSGLFNEDETFDLLYFANRTLYCISADEFSISKEIVELSLPTNVIIESELKDQLQLADINLDGKPDLLMFDKNRILLLLNQSNGKNFEFVEGADQIEMENIQSVQPFNADNNGFIDLFVVADSLYTLIDVRENLLPKDILSSASLSNATRSVSLADINLDGYKDAVLLSEGGELQIWHGLSDGYFSHVFTSGRDGYIDAHIADLDGDNDLEIAAAFSRGIDVFNMDWASGWNYYNFNVYSVHQSSQDIVRFVVNELGSSDHNQDQAWQDIAVITTDSLKVLENQIYIQDVFPFEERVESFHPLSFQPQQILYSDFSKDALLDLAVMDRLSGNFEVFTKNAWKPQIVTLNYRKKREIYFEWTDLPADQGQLMHYEVFRDTIPSISENSTNWRVNQPSFSDPSADPFMKYWYTVRAVDVDGTVSAASDPVPAQLFIELSANVSGVLDDSTRTYYVSQPIRIPVDQELTITPGVEIAFEPESRLDIYGTLNALGGGLEEEMVNFVSKYYEQNNWQGLNFFPSADTCKMEWFLVYGATRAITSRQRPLCLNFGGIEKNQVGIDFQGDSLALSNVLIDTNIVGLKLADNSRASIKNVNVLFTLDKGIHITENSKAQISNSILWHNNGPAVQSEVPEKNVRILYTTADSLRGPMQTYQITRQAPRFVSAGPGLYVADPASPTIDAGNPLDDYGLEPEPNGGRINQGVFGGSWHATTTQTARIDVKPKFVSNIATLSQIDTSIIFVKNSGYQTLTLLDVSQQNPDSPFSFDEVSPLSVLPGDSTRITILFKPQERINYRDTLIIESNDTRYFYSQIAVPLFGQGINTPPVITSQPERFAQPGETYHYTIEATDFDGDSLLFRANQMPGWLSISNNTVSGTPAISDTGIHRIIVDIQDGFGGSAQVNYRVYVSEDDSVGYLAPRIKILVKREINTTMSAVQFKFDVIQSGLIDLTDDQIRIRYYLQNTALDNHPEIIDTTYLNHISFYPLKDGNYEFKVWAYDYLGNGIEGENAESVNLTVEAARRGVSKYRWYMTALPRGETLQWYDFHLSDSAAMLLRWDEKEYDYLPVDRENIQAGSAFWIMPMKDIEFNLSMIEQVQPEPNNDIAGTLVVHKGWNQVGLPVCYTTNWKDMLFKPAQSDQTYSLTEAAEQGLIEPAVHWFYQLGKIQGYRMIELDSLALAYPWLGYWIKSTVDGEIQFSIKPSFVGVEDGNEIEVDNLGKKGRSEFKLNIALENEQYQDLDNIIGVKLDENRNVHEPPHFGEYCSLSFTDISGALTTSYKSESQSTEDVLKWDAVVQTRSADLNHKLSWDRNIINNSGYYVFLIDRQSELTIDMNTQTTYEFQPNGSTYQFSIYVCNDAGFEPDIIPLTHKLKQNYPNPFNPQTSIRFGVPESSKVQRTQLKIYDVLGRQVASLIEGDLKPGYHEVIWNGTNQNGDKVSTGVYFYRLNSGQQTLVRKMVLMK